MANYHVYECDRCGKKEQAASLPQYWAQIHAVDTNRTSCDSGVLDKDFCHNCMRIIRAEMERNPIVIDKVA